ncbi:MAG: hypothetical protein HOW73_24580 [Polyangiaceae bacterium]|nr:hypothetical protein [Polyangiaceae bacterium]
MRFCSDLASFAVVIGVLSLGCGGEVPDDDVGGGPAGGSSSDGGSGGTENATTGGMGGQGGQPSEGGGGAEPVGGNSEGGGGGAGWPTCDTQPAGSPTMTIPEVWEANPAAPEEAWVPGVYVTAVSNGGCTAGASCQIFVQQEESYADLDAARQQSLRIGVAPTVAMYFEGIDVGDRIDLYARAVRDTEDGKNELIFLVTPNLPGCAAVVGSGDPQPVVATLADLSVAAYEDVMGPVLVRVNGVSGNPNPPAETFALWTTGQAPDGDITTVTSLSPFFLAGGAFTGLTDGMNTNFNHVVGVFGLFVPPADPLIKYEEIYVRSDADYPLAN